MTYATCKRCGLFDPVSAHKCPPLWHVWQPDQDHGETIDDAKKIYAYSATSAAERWAEWDDRHSADYTIVRGDAATVHVRRADLAAGVETPTLIFSVTGESVPEYTARLISPKTEE